MSTPLTPGRRTEIAHDALDSLDDVVRFAYEQGYHEHGIPLVEIVREHMRALERERDELRDRADSYCDDFIRMCHRENRTVLVMRIVAQALERSRDAGGFLAKVLAAVKDAAPDAGQSA